MGVQCQAQGSRDQTSIGEPEFVWQGWERECEEGQDLMGFKVSTPRSGEPN